MTRVAVTVIPTRATMNHPKSVQRWKRRRRAKKQAANPNQAVAVAVAVAVVTRTQTARARAAQVRGKVIMGMLLDLN